MRRGYRTVYGPKYVCALFSKKHGRWEIRIYPKTVWVGDKSMSIQEQEKWCIAWGKEYAKSHNLSFRKIDPPDMESAFELPEVV